MIGWRCRNGLSERAAIANLLDRLLFGPELAYPLKRSDKSLSARSILVYLPKRRSHGPGNRDDLFQTWAMELNRNAVF
jgi:hypothetical protein